MNFTDFSISQEGFISNILATRKAKKEQDNAEVMAAFSKPNKIIAAVGKLITTKGKYELANNDEAYNIVKKECEIYTKTDTKGSGSYKVSKISGIPVVITSTNEGIIMYSIPVRNKKTGKLSLDILLATKPYYNKLKQYL